MPDRALFDDLQPRRPGRRSPEPVGAAPATDDDRRLASALPASVRLGTSSWSFPGWAGIVYDGPYSEARLAREGLAAYAKHPLLRAAGIDRTYYAPVGSASLAAYAAAVPAGFRFLVKAAAACTDAFVRVEGRRRESNPTYLDAGFAAAEVVAPFVEGLGEKAGPLVFQFPPPSGPERDPGGFVERLARFLEALPRGPLYAVEIRDRSVFGPAYLEALRSADARHCVNVHPSMPPVAEQAEALSALPDGPLVVRWMLHSGLAFEEARRRYEPFSRLVDEDPSARAALGALCLDHARRGLESYVIANNKAEGSAPLSLRLLAAWIAARLDSRPLDPVASSR